MDALAVARHLQPEGASTWSNLGFWGEDPATTPYPRAARALAIELGRAAALRPGQTLLDVGIGAGDQLAVWREEFGVERATALEPDPKAHAAADAHLREQRTITLLRAGADAVGTLPAGAFDRVLALDCAYHFASRDRFFAAARERLRPGGRLAFTDLARVPRVGGCWIGPLQRAFRVREALVPPQRYRERLAAAGFRDVSIEDWSEPVLRGFARHVGAHPALWTRAGGPALAVGLTALAARALAGRAVLYLRVVARNPG